ncbi:MAG: universal stress protein [Anaerolineae bacterium]
MVPLDGSLRAEYVLPMATELATRHDAELLLVHAVVPPEIFEQAPMSRDESAMMARVIEHNRVHAERHLERLAGTLGVRAQPVVLAGDDVAESLHRHAEVCGADLIIMCAHGRSGRHALPQGSVATSFFAYGTTHLLVAQDLSWHEVLGSAAARGAGQSLTESSSVGPHSPGGERRNSVRSTGSAPTQPRQGPSSSHAFTRFRSYRQSEWS